MFETSHAGNPLSNSSLLISHMLVSGWNPRITTRIFFLAFNWYLWNSILLFSRALNVRLNCCSSSVEIFMSPLAIVFSCCSWPATSSRVKIETKFCTSLTPHAVIGGGLYTFGTDWMTPLSINWVCFVCAFELISELWPASLCTVYLNL